MAKPIISNHSSDMYHHHHHTNNSRHHQPYPYPYPYPQDHHYSPSHHHQQESSYHRSRHSSNPSQLPTLTFQRPSPNEQTSHVLPSLLYPKSHHRPSHVDPNNRYPSSTPRNHPHTFGLRPNSSKYTSSRIVSPTSRASDLAKYAMTTNKDEKPIIDSDGNARHHSASEERRSLPPLSSSPNTNTLSIDVELSRKRKERDGDELLSPGTPNSTSSFLMTPQFNPAESSPNHKRRLSIIEHLALQEEDKSFNGPSKLVSIKGEEPFPWYKSSYDLLHFQQEPITVFPVQYQIYQQPNQNQNTNGSAQPQGTDNTTGGQQNNNNNSVPLDPTLSSIRSSVAPNSNGQQTQNLIDPSLGAAPELRFPDAETLASATASPSKDIPGEANTQAALAAVNTPTLTAEDAAALLSVPQTTDAQGEGGGSKKEQPFSRSPELRVSHKLAERKRRKEMKELFDELRDELPSDRGMKASKWEILSKAIDHIRQLKSGQEQMVREIDHLRREVDIARGGTGAYTHSYPTYNLAGTYPPTQNNFTSTPAATTPVTANAGNGQAQQPQQQQQPHQQNQQPQQQQVQQTPAQQPDQLNQIKADVPQAATQ